MDKIYSHILPKKGLREECVCNNQQRKTCSLPQSVKNGLFVARTAWLEEERYLSLCKSFEVITRSYFPTKRNFTLRCRAKRQQNANNKHEINVEQRDDSLIFLIRSRYNYPSRRRTLPPLKIKSRRLNVVVGGGWIEGVRITLQQIYKAYKYKRSPSVQRTYCVQKMMVKW